MRIVALTMRSMKRGSMLLRARRQERGLSLFRLAVLTEIDQARLSRLENDQATPTLEQSLIFEREFGIEPSAWMEEIALAAPDTSLVAAEG
jgi:transcriptional regulator with XRE-family HTH domain